ncbi:MAG: twin-arginine translocation signal domain-containing protein, partial [Rhodoferax sp.]|nr:twin-arginine translocation signal domain-containing protein [Rhodoferax sp.]
MEIKIMPTPKLTRRNFLQGCSYAIASMAGARLTNLAFAQENNPFDTLVVVFLRGGWDALNVVPPLQGD